jgi:preprotein translocase subunit YajC
MYTNSNRHRMGTHQSKVNKLKEGDDILYSCGDMIGSGTVFQIKETEIIVQTGNGARGLEYINKSQVIFK